MAEARWYVVHTYSGYENKVKTDLEKTIRNRHLEDLILDVQVPTEEVTEIRNGARKKVTRKLFPGYVLVNMVHNDDTWYVVRNTRGVTGFVGPGSEPVPLSDEELRNMGGESGRVEIDVEVGDTVQVVAGPWEDNKGVVLSIDNEEQTVTISMDIFERDTPVEVGFTEIRKA